jgi:hypothetical protein
MGDVRAEARGGGSTWGDTIPSFRAANGTTKKIYKIHRGFWQPPIDDTHTTTNQKQAYAMDGGMDEGHKRRESMGGYKSIVLAVIELEE